MLQKVIKAGNSKAVTIPADFVKVIGIRLGDTVKSVSRPERGELTYTFSGARQLSMTQDFSKQRQ